ncbi:hypothetical protein GCM10018962_45250 [Dactylosporangium matsuzakiense]
MKYSTLTLKNTPFDSEDAIVDQVNARVVGSAGFRCTASHSVMAGRRIIAGNTAAVVALSGPLPPTM